MSKKDSNNKFSITLSFTETTKELSTGKPFTVYSFDIVDNNKYKVVKLRYRKYNYIKNSILMLNQKVRMSLNVLERSDMLYKLPKLPAKRFFNSLTADVIQERKQAISLFMNVLSKIASEEPSIHRLINNILADPEKNDSKNNLSRSSSIEYYYLIIRNMDVVVYKGILYMMNIAELHYEWVKRFVFLKNDKLYLYTSSSSTLLTTIDLSTGGCIGIVPASSIPYITANSVLLFYYFRK